jgi:SAM-dependent methyltransferase
VALGLASRRGADFEPTPLARECLAPGAPRDLLDYLKLDADSFDAWARVEDALRSGLPVEVSSRAATEGHGERHRNFIRAMRSTARGNAPLVAARLDLATVLGRAPRRLLDLGAGPGSYAVEFCRRWADLRATAFDLPETVAIAREVVAQDAPPEVAARVEFREGDFHRDPLGGPYDVVWLSHVIHGHPEATLGPLLARVAAAVEAGGAVVVHDFVLDESRARPAFGALFALNMLVMSDRGRTYSFAEVRALLEAAGFVGARWVSLGEARGISVVVAWRGPGAAAG